MWNRSTNDMRELLILVLGLCFFVHSSQVENGIENRDASEPHNLQETLDAGNQSSHINAHNGVGITAAALELSREESKYFVSALFEKYYDSQTLSLDGFARLYCSLGLVLTFAETTNEADDTNAGSLSGEESMDCGKITFDEVQAIFEEQEKRKHEHAEYRHEHKDDHSDHDHQPNRNVGGAKSSSAQGGHTHHHDDDVDRAHDDHDHADHSRDNHHDDAKHPNDSSPSTDGRRKREADIVSDSFTSSAPANQQATRGHPNRSTCTSPKELLQLFHLPLAGLSADDFILLCPALLFQIDSGTCRRPLHDHNHDHEHAAQQSKFFTLPGKVWGYSTVAVFVISLAGLLGVAVIPIMQKVFYNHLLQFLVAVAVGALSGDALLHLLPHAISKNLVHDHGVHDDHDHGVHDDHDHGSVDTSADADHLEAVWKGLVALICIFCFFLLERILTIVTEKKRQKKSVARLKKKHCEQLCDIEKSGGVGAKLAAHEGSDFTNCDHMVMVVHPNRALKGYADATHDSLLHQCDENLSQAEPTLDNNDHDSSFPALGHSHSHSHGHGHGHGHAHCDMVPGSVAAVAWMVILGDGIHNFSDGLAIGAAFASSVTGGVSTSVAVLCHELPHEIGDFAVLLRAGMSVKQAVVYNCVSSILCFIGMLVGVAIGNIHNASLWVFAGVGGMFLYISMVDMLPEMTAVDTKKGENQYLHLLLQVMGMMLGSGIMLLIAIYEHDLQRSLG